MDYEFVSSPLRSTHLEEVWYRHIALVVRLLWRAELGTDYAVCLAIVCLEANKLAKFMVCLLFLISNKQ